MKNKQTEETKSARKAKRESKCKNQIENFLFCFQSWQVRECIPSLLWGNILKALVASNTTKETQPSSKIQSHCLITKYSTSKIKGKKA